MPKQNAKKTTFTGLDNTVIEFLTSQNHSTLHTYKSFFKLITKYTGMNGQQLLESKQTDKAFEWERKVVQLKQWVKTQQTCNGSYYSDLAAQGVVTTLRSFFEYYREPLKFNQSEKRRLNSRSHRKTMDYRLENEDLIKMNADANLREKYVLLVGKSFGLRISDFIKFTYGTYRSINLNLEPPIFFGEIQTIKEGILAFPFIDADALQTIKKLLEQNKNKPDTERILTVQQEEVTTILQKLALRVGINFGGKILRFHCLRKYLIDRLANNMSESKWKQIVGKAISEDAYVSPYELRTGYANTMRWTTVAVNPAEMMGFSLEDIENVKEIVKNAGLYRELRDLMVQNKLVNIDDPELINRLKLEGKLK